MAKSKKTKASTKAKRAASANKARNALIKKEIAKYEANKKRAANLKKARKALAQKEVDKANRKNKRKIAQARSSARAANRRAYAADQRANAASARAQAASERANAAERKAAARSAENYQLHKELSRRKRPAGARVISMSAIWLAVGALVFAIIFVVLYWMVADKKGGSSFNYIDAQIAYLVFLVLMFATIIGLLVLVSPLWGTLRRENHLTPLAKASLIIIWLFCAFSLAVFIIDILTSAQQYDSTNQLINELKGEKVLNLITIGSPVALLLFSGLLYGSVKRSYPLA